MPHTIADDDAIKLFSVLLERAHAGEEIVLTRAGKPYARVTPLAPPRRKLGFLAGHVDECFFDPLPESELQRWEGK